MDEISKENKQPLDVLVLAAGLGTRMRSDLAKVLHKIDGKALIAHVVACAAALDPRHIYVVVGHQAEAVKAAVLQELDEEKVSFALQTEQLGTGHAVNSARQFLADKDSTLLILSGDVPLIRASTLAKLIQNHRSHRGTGAGATILTVKLDDPTGYGRIVRDESGFFDKIVEQKDAGEEERKVREINSGIYCFNTRKLFDVLSRVGNNNNQGEYYLTDAPHILREEGDSVSLYLHNDVREVSGINNRAELAEMERAVRTRTINKLMLDYGVTFIDPKHAYISSETEIGRDTIIYPNVMIEGATVIGDGCEIRSGVRLTNAKIGRGVTILDNCVITDSEIGDECSVGPSAHLRGGAKMEDTAKVGNFVEMKNALLGRGAKSMHLTYLGDAEIGEKSNIGAGTITCNYDGKNKHRTKIGKNVKIGSDTMLIAPVEVGDGAVTGAGSVVTKDVEPNKLVVGAPAAAIKTLNREEG